VKKGVTTFLEIAAIFCLATFLLKLAICFLSQIWIALLVIVVLTAAGLFAWRWWKNHRGY
jgi:predicted negative regulator of RcsB-dependent stress response